MIEALVRAVEFSERAAQALTSLGEQLADWIETHPETIERARCLAEALTQVIEGPKTLYSAVLEAEGLDRSTARLLGAALPVFGKQLRQQIVSEQALARALRRFAKHRSKGPLAQSGQARKLSVELQRPDLRHALGYDVILAQELEELIKATIAREKGAGDRLVQLCAKYCAGKRLKAPIPTIETTTHAMLLLNVEASYTYNFHDDCFDDPMTRATRTHFKLRKFDPRTARNLVAGDKLTQGCKLQ